MGPPMIYEVRYREGTTGNFTKTNYNSRETNFTLSDLRRGRQYQVQVRAKNDEGTSAWSPSGIGTPETSPPIDFPDTALRAKVAEALGKRSNAAITAVDLLALTELHAPNANIRNLTGIQHAHNLRRLFLGGEYIEEEQRISYNDALSDLSPLQGANATDDTGSFWHWCLRRIATVRIDSTNVVATLQHASLGSISTHGVDTIDGLKSVKYPCFGCIFAHRVGTIDVLGSFKYPHFRCVATFQA